MRRLFKATRLSWALVSLCACALRTAATPDDAPPPPDVRVAPADATDAQPPPDATTVDARLPSDARGGITDALSTDDRPDAAGAMEAGCPPDGFHPPHDADPARDPTDDLVRDAAVVACGDASADGGCPGEIRVGWRDDPAPVAQPAPVPLTLAPDGTVYLARAFVDGARRVVHGEETQRTLVAGFDADGHIVAAVPQVGGLHIFAGGLTADGGGFYALASYAAGFTLSGLTTPAPPTLTACVLAFDRTGALRWMLPLGTGVWDAGSLLSRVADGHLVLAGAVVGAVTLGAAPFVDAPSPALVRVDLGADGAVRASRVLGALRTGRVHAAINPSGRLSTLVDAPADDAGAASAARLTLWEPDGRLRYAQTTTWGLLALDDAGRSYLTSPDLCTATGDGTCITSLDPDGVRRWSIRFTPRDPHGLDYPGVPGMTWLTVRGDALDLVTFRSQHEWYGSCAPAICTRRSVGIGIARIGLDGSALATDARSGQGAFVEGGGRRCGLSFEWVGLGCGSSSTLPLAGDLTCTRSAPRCPYGTEFCDGACVDRASDPDHCGACGHRCDGMLPHAAGACAAGACAYPTCDVGWASCDGDLSNGCETDLRADASHCGACGVACAAGQRCDGGRCCAGDACQPGPFVSDGHEGAFDPARDVELSPGVHHFTTVNVRSGVTVLAPPGAVVEIRAQGAVQIDGLLDLRGVDGARRSEYGTACVPDAPPGPAAGERGYLWPQDGLRCSGYGSADASWRSALPSLPAVYGDTRASRASGGACGSHNCTPPGAWDEGTRAGTGSIGLDAFEDLAIDRVLSPGSRGGEQLAYEYVAGGLRQEGFVTSGGGGGGAVRIASATSIVVRGSVLANGGSPGGSGGAIALYAPSVTVARDARVEAGGAALGRVRIATDPARCVLEGRVIPTPVDGCNAHARHARIGHAVVTGWPL